jgi:hypothetical protein
VAQVSQARSPRPPWPTEEVEDDDDDAPPLALADVVAALPPAPLLELEVPPLEHATDARSAAKQARAKRRPAASFMARRS